MEAILTTFGVDWRLLLIQGINVGVLLFGLWYFLYAPLTKMLDLRREKVVQGVKDAQKAAEELSQIERARAGKLAEAGKEADTIVSQARTAAGAKERELVEAAEGAAQRIVVAAEGQAKELKAQAIAESKEEVAKMIVLGMERVLKEKSV